MELRIGDKVRVLIERCGNNYNKTYLQECVKGREFRISEIVHGNLIILHNCGYAFRSQVLEKIENTDIEHWIGPTKEYSMQEIADALKIDVKELRIKK